MTRRAEGESPVARQILLLQVGVVVVLVVTAVALAALDARRDSREAARDQATAVARSVADSPFVRQEVLAADPTTPLQPFAEEVRRDTGTDFVVVMDTDRTRWTHPDPTQIGGKFVGDLGGAPEGRVFTQEYAGTLGPSIRAVVPVTDGGKVLALVAVGITVDKLDRQLLGDLPGIALAAGVTLLAGLLGAWLIARRLRRQTHGLGEREITRMYEYYRAVLGAVREGLLLVDSDLRVQLVNDEARRLLALPDEVEGRSLTDLGLPPGLVRAVEQRTAVADETYVLGQQVLVLSTSPAYWHQDEVGAVVTVRDRTELQAVTGELDLVRGLTESLRSQNHEAANRLHTIVSLVEMGRPEQAVEFATAELQLAQGLADELVSAVEEPVLAALLLGKTAQAAERGIDLDIEGELPALLPVEARDLVALVGNLVDNAFDAVAETRGERPQRVRVGLAGDVDHLRIEVDDSGPGIAPEDRAHVLDRGWSSKASEGRGLGLAIVTQVVSGHGGRLDVTDSPLGGARFALTVDADGKESG
ncbi:sensor histidine kinase regulating citrate/malate metabolism [Nocardioides sp. BE266]|uniref:sensor histidine kinase n=1 Tax=Nocardioides sp. BE266 TaxID=2817725 RepID=UPI002857B412|nr:sensor histidine kinase [Nocardioides sp. BE266]MDR7254607.1 sensor histidine kinase regulating citrate/malate metabolism [Nocardioides sp. BE266]